jgi:hypothetical protein
MEETLVEFQKKFHNLIDDTKYFFVYDTDGNVEAMQPTDVCSDEKFSVEVSKDIVDLIYTTQEVLSSYKVDVVSRSIFKKKSIDIVSIDDVVHRIIEKKYTSQEPDISILYDNSKKCLSFSLNSKHHNTIWSGNTSLYFTVTKYNDPNDILSFISFPVESLISEDIKIDVSYITERFSLYTRRIFKNYVVEYL